MTFNLISTALFVALNSEGPGQKRALSALVAIQNY